MNSMALEQENLHSALAAPGRSPEIPEEADVYGWLVGSWDLKILHYRAEDVSGIDLEGEVHFGWVLEGRAIQDVWIMPRRSKRTLETDKINNMFGTTLRVWDPAIQAWRITWINPVRGHCEEQIGRWIGDEIVQVGARADGTPTRWRYTEITNDTFRWIGESLLPDGQTWKLEGEFRAKRARAYALTGDPLAAEPCCIYQPKNWDPEREQTAEAFKQPLPENTLVML